MAVVDGNAGSAMVQSAVTPTQGVRPVNVMGEVANLASGLGQLYGQKQQIDAQQEVVQQKATENGIVSDYRAKMLRIVQAASSGNLDRGRAQTRANATLAEFNSKYPSLSDQIFKAHSDIMTMEGLGTVITEETPQEKEDKENLDTAIELGMEIPDNPIEYERVLDIARQHRATIAKGAEETRKHERDMQKLNRESKEFELAQQRFKKKQGELIVDLAESYYPVLNNQFDSVRARFDAGMSSTEAELELKKNWANVDATLRSMAGSDLQPLAEAMTKPMLDLYDFNIKYVKGLATKEELETKKETTLLRLQNLALLNSELARGVAASELLGGGFLAAQTLDVKTSMSEFIIGGRNIVTDKNRDKVIETLNVSLQDPNIPDEEKVSYIERLFENFEEAGASIDNPEQLNALVKMSASPEFRAFTKKNPEVLGKLGENATNAITEYYQGPVLEGVVKFWEKGTTSFIDATKSEFMTEPSKPKRYSDLVEPYFNGSGLAFRAQAGVLYEEARQVIRELEEPVTKRVNRLIKSGAHLQNTDDYEAIFNQKIQAILGLDPTKLDEPDSEDSEE